MKNPHSGIIKIQDLHAWTTNPTEAVQIQKTLREQIEIQPFRGKLQLIAGADVSFNKYSPLMYASFVVLDINNLSVIETTNAVVKVEFPYIPGLLSFREIPALIEAAQQLKHEPDVFIFDGQGIAHPRRLGIATHMGLLLQRPSIGCGKSLLTGIFEELGQTAGSSSPLIAQGEQVGIALRTKTNTKPVFISPGHLMDIPSAKKIILKTLKGYRLPEPTRQAHLQVNKFRQSQAIGLRQTSDENAAKI